MPGRFLTDAERERLRRFPTEVPPEDLVDYFTLSDRDQAQVRRQRGSANRLGFALQLGTLRYLGFVPDPLRSVPRPSSPISPSSWGPLPSPSRPMATALTRGLITFRR